MSRTRRRRSVPSPLELPCCLVSGLRLRRRSKRRSRATADVVLSFEGRIVLIQPGLLFLICSNTRLMLTAAERQLEAGHGDRMQAVRRSDDAGNGDQAAAWRSRLSRNTIAGRLPRDMQAERADGKPRHHATANRHQWPATPKPHRIFAHVVARRAFRSGDVEWV
jgi:hypothetical protein